MSVECRSQVLLKANLVPRFPTVIRKVRVRACSVAARPEIRAFLSLRMFVLSIVNMDFESILEEILLGKGQGNLKLKPKQKVALQAIILKGQDCLIVLPTGYGKSLTYQMLPSLYKAVYTTGKFGPDPPKKAVRNHNFCKETLEFLQGHRRLWPCRNSSVSLQKLWVRTAFFGGSGPNFPVV